MKRHALLSGSITLFALLLGGEVGRDLSVCISASGTGSDTLLLLSFRYPILNFIKFPHWRLEGSCLQRLLQVVVLVERISFGRYAGKR